MRAKYLIGLLVIIFTFLSCKRDPLPEGAIDRKTFINVLTDIHLAEGMYSERHRLKLDSLESASTLYFSFKKYNVTERSNACYYIILFKTSPNMIKFSLKC